MQDVYVQKCISLLLTFWVYLLTLKIIRIVLLNILLNILHVGYRKLFILYRTYSTLDKIYRLSYKKNILISPVVSPTVLVTIQELFEGKYE